jgi:hypothetical protein
VLHQMTNALSPFALMRYDLHIDCRLVWARGLAKNPSYMWY